MSCNLHFCLDQKYSLSKNKTSTCYFTLLFARLKYQQHSRDKVKYYLYSAPQGASGCPCWNSYATCWLSLAMHIQTRQAPLLRKEEDLRARVLSWANSLKAQQTAETLGDLLCILHCCRLELTQRTSTKLHHSKPAFLLFCTDVFCCPSMNLICLFSIDLCPQVCSSF